MSSLRGQAKNAFVSKFTKPTKLNFDNHKKRKTVDLPEDYFDNNNNSRNIPFDFSDGDSLQDRFESSSSDEDEEIDEIEDSGNIPDEIPENPNVLRALIQKGTGKKLPGDLYIPEDCTEPFKVSKPVKALRKKDSSRDFVFTINNPKDEDAERLHEMLKAKKISYFIFKPERGIGSRTLHLQGYLQVPQVRQVMWVSKNILPRAYIAIRYAKSTPELARNYVLKEETAAGPIEESGIFLKALEKGVVASDTSNKGQVREKGILSEIFKKVADGASVKDIASNPEFQTVWARNHNAIGKYVSIVTESSRAPVVEYKLEQFNVLNVPVEDLTKKAVILMGDTNIGKTSFAKAHINLFPGKKVLVIRQIEDLKGIDKETGLLVFDDMQFTSKNTSDTTYGRSQQIHLLDMNDSSSIHSRFENAFIPKGMPRIFTCNPGVAVFDLFDDAILRRVKQFDLGKQALFTKSVHQIALDKEIGSTYSLQLRNPRDLPAVLAETMENDPYESDAHKKFVEKSRSVYGESQLKRQNATVSNKEDEPEIVELA